MLKRLFDILGSGLALVLTAPLWPVIALFIKLESRGSVFYRQWRVGAGEKPFQICKFRTMVEEADRLGSAITLAGDRRITRVGRVLRRFELDELPTLLNVLRGDMSIVGPRPEIPRFLPYYTHEQKRALFVKPGLTDPGTLTFRNEATALAGPDPEQVYVTEILPRKLALNLQYVDNQSFLHDLAIIGKTLLKVLLEPKE